MTEGVSSDVQGLAICTHARTGLRHGAQPSGSTVQAQMSLPVAEIGKVGGDWPIGLIGCIWTR